MKKKKLFASGEIFLLVFGTIAIAFILGNIGFASADSAVINPATDTPTNPGYSDYVGVGSAPSTATIPTVSGASGGGYLQFTKDAIISSGGQSVKIPAGSVGKFNSAGELTTTNSFGTETTWSAAESGPIADQAIAGGYASKGGVNTPLGSFSTGSIFFDSAITGLFWAIAVAGLIQVVGNLFGVEGEIVNAVSYAAAAGVFAGKTASGISGVSGAAAIGIGIAVAAVVLIATYKKEKTRTIIFQCLPWEPPKGGDECGKCNVNSDLPCSEYRCRALGKACELVQQGNQDVCVWKNPDDATSPVINPDESALKPSELKYTGHDTRPPSLGVKIINTQATNNCLKPFTALEFGVSTNEPAVCKVDYNHTNSFDAMAFQFDSTGTFNHSLKMRLPSPSAEGITYGPLLENGDTFNLFVRCEDPNGNSNSDEYAVSFCVDPAPDTTAPLIEASSIKTNSPVRAGVDEVPIEFYLNEPAECRWSLNDVPYDDMVSQMSCATSVEQVNSNLQYPCSTTLTGVQDRVENKYYVRCKDNPEKAESERNVMSQSYVLVLKGSQPLNILDTAPNNTITGSTTSVKVDLTAETDDGSEEGKAVCSFSPSGAEGTFIKMFATNSFKHSQTLSLGTGSYNYYFRCVDSGGNVAEKTTSFSVFVDKSPPIVSRAYRKGSSIQVVTNEDAQCVYGTTSCNYVFEEGLAMSYVDVNSKKKHSAESTASSTYYIKCKDDFGSQPDPNDCSIIVSSI
jgi:hypothetical protein